MKKVININFQGRVIPIEETAYDILQKYITSLRNYFANENGRDEIINDIENRIGELFDEKLKKGSACIMEADVQQIMNNMGRPEDFDQQDEPVNTNNNNRQNQSNQANAGQAASGSQPKKRLYRDEEDKILGGVASGLAHYLNIDPAIIRILFALLVIFGGSGFVIYVIMWIVLPSRSLVTNIRKRLYRDTDDRVIAGVCGGLAKYFDINPAIPRIIFAAPFIFGIVTSIGRSFFDFGSVAIGGFGGGTFILTYIILWIVLPEAFTASEKLEMKGEKVDLNSIRDTVVNDLHGLKGRAEKLGAEVKESAERLGAEITERSKEFGGEFSQKSAAMGSDINQSMRRSGSGLGHAISVLAKAFMYMVGGSIVFALFVLLIVLLGSGVGFLPLQDYFLQGEWQTLFAWGTLVLFLGVPILALMVWFIRRLMQVKTHNKYLGLSFGALWTLGWFFVVFLIASVSRSFSNQIGKAEVIKLQQPSTGKMLVKVANSDMTYENNWVNWDDLVRVENDSLYLQTTRVNIIKSSDSLYHVHLVKMSKGANKENAQALVEKLAFNVVQNASMLILPEAFAVSKNDKWRNQSVLVVIEVPVGKKINMDQRVNDFNYFNIDFGRRRNYRSDWNKGWERGWDNTENWEANEDMIMTSKGLELVNKRDDEDNNEEELPAPAAPGAPTAPAAPQKDSLKKDTLYQYKASTPSDAPSVQEQEDADPTENSAGMDNSSKPGTSILSNPLGAIMRGF